MPTCPACQREVPEAAMAECPFCGVFLAKWKPNTSPKQAGEQGPPSNAIPQGSIGARSNKATKQQMIAGLCVTLLGLVMEFVGGNAFLAGIAISIVGLAIYARTRGHSIAYSAWGLIPVVGTLIGLLYLNLCSPQAKKLVSPWEVAFTIALLFAMVLGLVRWIHQRSDALYESEKAGRPIVEALEKSSDWWVVHVTRQFSEKPYGSRGGEGDCGSIHKTPDGKISFRPLPEGPESSHANVQDIFKAHPQLFAMCPIYSVTYSTFLFSKVTVDVQVDASGKIVLAKKPRTWD